jgi:hypothetical protein
MMRLLMALGLNNNLRGHASEMPQPRPDSFRRVDDAPLDSSLHFFHYFFAQSYAFLLPVGSITQKILSVSTYSGLCPNKSQVVLSYTDGTPWISLHDLLTPLPSESCANTPPSLALARPILLLLAPSCFRLLLLAFACYFSLSLAPSHRRLLLAFTRSFPHRPQFAFSLYYR